MEVFTTSSEQRRIPKWLLNLSQSDLALLKNFIINSGNIKSVAAFYTVSYPTMRARIDLLIEKIRIGDRETDIFVKKLQTYAIENKLSSQIVQDIAQLYYTKD